MNNFNLGHMISRFVRYQQKGEMLQNLTKPQNYEIGRLDSKMQSSTPNPTTSSSSTPSTPQGTTPASAFTEADKSVYVKDLMKLPRNMNELIVKVQQNLTQTQLNKILNQQANAKAKALSQTQAQILAQLQGLNTKDVETVVKAQMNNVQNASTLKNIQIASSQMINLSQISSLIQTNGKEAVTKLILAMANAAKQGSGDIHQLKETAKLINASVALASSDNPAQTLKTLMLLYLPWLPLHEGADFDIDVEVSGGGSPSDSILIVTITTVNYGILIGTLLLENQNSVHINIECSEKFPKEELLKRMSEDEKNYSMQSVISIETKKVSENIQKPESTNAKINMSHTNEISPYLLLAAHSLIRYTIELDRG
ncbi:hypothetical protein J6A31_08160 [bacterium]|nr:hypothetical protein [bacterium]